MFATVGCTAVVNDDTTNELTTMSPCNVCGLNRPYLVIARVTLVTVCNDPLSITICPTCTLDIGNSMVDVMVFDDNDALLATATWIKCPPDAYNSAIDPVCKRTTGRRM